MHRKLKRQDPGGNHGIKKEDIKTKIIAQAGINTHTHWTEAVREDKPSPRLSLSLSVPLRHVAELQ